jgi:hypothetical protein
MKLDHGSRTVVISNPRIYDYLQQNNTDLDEIEIILERICAMCDYNKIVKDRLKSNSMFDKLKGDIVNGVNHELKQSHDKYLQLINNQLQGMINSLHNDIKPINKHQSSYQDQEEAEHRMIDLLESKLTSRNGYEVIDCRSQPNKLDILIKKSGYNDVRIDIKNNGKDSNDDSIKINEVKQFENDILNCSCHGICVSLHSNIHGKEEIQFDTLLNGKCVIFLSNNEYDVNFIIELLQILQFIDDKSRNEKQSSEDDDSISLSSDTVQKINEILKESEQKVYDLKTKLEQSIKLVSSIKFDLINNLFRGQHLLKYVQPPEYDSITCEHCGKIIRNCKGALKKHLKYCHVLLSQTKS